MMITRFFLFGLLLFSITIEAQQTKTVVFKTGLNNVWTIPASVTSVTIEAWGGGGGGGNFAGGQGSGYFKVQFPVRALSQISCVIGIGGTGGSNNGADGNNTEVVYTESNPSKVIRFTAQGGQGGNNSSSLVKGGYSYSTLATPFTPNWTGANGQYGSTTENTALTMKDTDNIIWSETGGDGGEAGNTQNTRGWGGAITSLMRQNRPTLTYAVITSLSSKTPAPGTQPGGGGGAMPNLLPPLSPRPIGANGAEGMV